MSVLWVDKYHPRELSQLDYHKQQAVYLQNLVRDGDFPHLLVHGPSGAGKQTRIMCLLREIYGPGVERMRTEQLEFLTPSKKKIEITTLYSNYHIEVNPSDVDMQDRVVVTEIMRHVSQSQQLIGKDFKVIVFKDVDELSKEAQHALRRTMEKYVANCRLILCANSTSRVTDAIRSRCLSIRVPAPDSQEIVNILHTICKKEGLDLPQELAERIAEKSCGNLRRAILMCEVCKVQQYPFTPSQTVTESEYLLFIKHIAETVNEGLKGVAANAAVASKLLLAIREKFYEALINGIPVATLFEGLVDALCDDIPDTSSKLKVVETANEYEHRCLLGNKPIFHMEAFVMAYIKIRITSGVGSL